MKRNGKGLPPQPCDSLLLPNPIHCLKRASVFGGAIAHILHLESMHHNQLGTRPDFHYVKRSNHKSRNHYPSASHSSPTPRNGTGDKVLNSLECLVETHLGQTTDDSMSTQNRLKALSGNALPKEFTRTEKTEDG